MGSRRPGPNAGRSRERLGDGDGLAVLLVVEVLERQHGLGVAQLQTLLAAALVVGGELQAVLQGGRDDGLVFLVFLVVAGRR